MLHVGLDLSRRRLDVCVLSDDGELVEELAAAPAAEGLRYLVGKLARHREPVRAVIESMTGARFVHDALERLGWDVLIADVQRVKGLAPVACKTDRVDARVLAVLSHRNLVPAIWLPDPRVRREREQARGVNFGMRRRARNPSCRPVRRIAVSERRSWSVYAAACRSFAGKRIARACPGWCRVAVQRLAICGGASGAATR